MSRRDNSPSARWSREHGYKVVHRDVWSAWRHALSLNRRKWRDVISDRKVWRPYECRWDRWFFQGQAGVPHWHVGRPPTGVRRGLLSSLSRVRITALYAALYLLTCALLYVLACGVLDTGSGAQVAVVLWVVTRMFGALVALVWEARRRSQ